MIIGVVSIEHAHRCDRAKLVSILHTTALHAPSRLSPPATPQVRLLLAAYVWLLLVLPYWPFYTLLPWGVDLNQPPGQGAFQACRQVRYPLSGLGK
jgi:hypothetical protein